MNEFCAISYSCVRFRNWTRFIALVLSSNSVHASTNIRFSWAKFVHTSTSARFFVNEFRNCEYDCSLFCKRSTHIQIQNSYFCVRMLVSVLIFGSQEDKKSNSNDLSYISILLTFKIFTTLWFIIYVSGIEGTGSGWSCGLLVS